MDEQAAREAQEHERRRAEEERWRHDPKREEEHRRLHEEHWREEQRRREDFHRREEHFRMEGHPRERFHDGRPPPRGPPGPPIFIMMIFRALKFTGFFTHICGALVLFSMVVWNGNGSGVSCKAQELYLFVFASRLLHNREISFYTLFMLLITGAIVYKLRFGTLRPAYEKSQDIFHSRYVVILSALLAAGISLKGDPNQRNVPFEFGLILHWSGIFANLLESWAMLPQLLMYYRNVAMHLTSHRGQVRWAILCFAIYRHAETLLFVLHLEGGLTERMWWEFVVCALGFVELAAYWDIMGFRGRIITRFLLANMSDKGPPIPEYYGAMIL